MIKPRRLQSGDRIAIVSLSSGMLGEPFCSHNIEIGVRRLESLGLTPVFMPNARKGIDYLKQHPQKRAEDLKQAFLDDSLQGILCAIGGDDTYRLLPFLLEDDAFLGAVRRAPKLFSGFSDTTVNHLMFRRLGLQTFYGPSFLCDLGEIADEMLPYTKAAFQGYFHDYAEWTIRPSELWYEERTDFSRAAMGTERVRHRETHGYELLQGSPVFEGELLGGCLESLSDTLTSERYPDEGAICRRYRIFPNRAEWRGKIMFLETSEEKPTPERFDRMLSALAQAGAFDAISGVLFGKPQDEQYYEAYKPILCKAVNDDRIPILYNINFGHATPRAALPYGAYARVDAEQQAITFPQRRPGARR